MYRTVLLEYNMYRMYMYPRLIGERAEACEKLAFANGRRLM